MSKYSSQNLTAIGILFLIVLTGSYFYFSKHTEKINLPFSGITLGEAVKSVYDKYGNPEIIYSDENRVWFAKPHAMDGCNRYSYVELKTGNEKSTDLVACPEVPVSQSAPYYVEYCASYYGDCYDFKTLYVTNLKTLERKAVHTVTSPDETTKAVCEKYDEEVTCTPQIDVRSGLLTIKIYKNEPTQEGETHTNTLIRAEEINLNEAFETK